MRFPGRNDIPSYLFRAHGLHWGESSRPMTCTGEHTMRRRDFFSTVLAGVPTASLLSRLNAAEIASNPGRFLLSAQGCGRATGYAETNKIITCGDKTHACWLDSAPEGFRARIRTLDRRTGLWSPTYTLGE